MEIKKMVSICKSMDCSGLLREPFVVSSRNYTKSSCLGNVLFKFKTRIYLPGRGFPIKVTKMLAVSHRGIRGRNGPFGLIKGVQGGEETFLSIKTSPRVKQETHRQVSFSGFHFSIFRRWTTPATFMWETPGDSYTIT